MRALLAAAVLFLLTAVAPADPVRLTTDGSFRQNLQWSPDGSRLLFTRIHEGKMALWTMAADGTDAKRLLPQHKEPHFDGHWSPDGKRVVYVYDRLEGTDGKLQINHCAADGSDDRVLVPHKAFEESPRWSPDGGRVLWVSTRDKNPELYTVGADGKGVTRLTTEVAYDLHPAWSPDGKRIAFASGRSGRQKLYVMNADGTGTKKLTEGDGLDAHPAWSPDGKRIAFVSHRTGNNDVWLINADGAGLRNLTAHPAQDTSPTWSPDGRRLAFVSTRHGGSDVYVLSAEPAPVTDRDALYAAVLAAPDDDTPRLVYADYLDDTGDRMDGIRARFIRNQVALARAEPWSDEYDTLYRATEPVQVEYRKAWVTGIDGIVVADGNNFDRGFLGRVTCYTKKFVADGATVFERHPIRAVKFARMNSTRGAATAADLAASHSSPASTPFT